MKKRKALVVANWKSSILRPADARALLKRITARISSVKRATLVIAPPSVFLTDLAARSRRVQFAAQDISALPLGPYTGEVSAEAALGAGARYTIVGHAERRALGETDAVVAEKARAALNAGLEPIVCIGEAVRDRDGAFFSAIEDMLFRSLARIEPEELAQVVIAYEPVWAIGAPRAPDPRTVNEAVLFVRKSLAERFGRENAARARILYGGAVDALSAHEFATGSADGFLVGRASLESDSCIGILRAWELNALKR